MRGRGPAGLPDFPEKGEKRLNKILVVDDEKLIADGLRAMLAEAFAGTAEVGCCYSAKDAVEILTGAPADVLLTDINMPNWSGLELHEEVSRFSPETRVIYLTGYSDFEYARKALDQHAFAYVLKGEGDESVVRTVSRALAAEDRSGNAPAQAPAAPESDAEASLPEWVQDLHGFIRSRLAEDLSLNVLAEHCHFHPVYLSRTYREVTGKTLSDFISSARLRKARELLQESRMNIREIAKCTGFASDNYFCRWFRKQTGESPQEFRKTEL